MKLGYCCEFPNQRLFLDSHGTRDTAVVYCSACQKIAAEIWLDNGEDVWKGEEE